MEAAALAAASAASHATAARAVSYSHGHHSLALRAKGIASLRFHRGTQFADNTREGTRDCASRRGSRLVLQVRCDAGTAVVKERVGDGVEGKSLKQDFTTVMKFGGSSVASAHRMKEVASLILSFPEERPIIVLSAMGKTTNNLLKVLLKFGVWMGLGFCVVWNVGRDGGERWG
jgi:hypothetical protein